MRIVIAAPPKAGNSWLKCLLGAIYELEWLRGSDVPERAVRDAFAAWVASGGFRDGTIYHQHYNYSPELADAVAAVPAHLVTIIRDPYDMFVSGFFFVQAQASVEGRSERASDPMIGKAIDDPAVLDFLANDFGDALAKANGWLHSHRSIVVRYERLHDDPIGELTGATNRISPVDPVRIHRSIGTCDAATLRKSRKGLRKRIRSATVGDWRNYLTETHLTIFRDRYADQIRSLGYDVQ